MKDVNATLITIGDELLIGQTIDTNSSYISAKLNAIGIWVKKRIAIGDDRNDILSTLREAGMESQVVVITGGLGPTADDITKPTLCEFFGSTLVVDEGALENVKKIFARHNRPLIERNIRQADVPSNCMVLQNKRGTAPGMWFGKPSSEKFQSPHHPGTDTIYISLPGVPYEMKGLVDETVIPMLKENLDLPAVVHRTLLTSGIGESMLAEEIQELEHDLPPHIKLAYLPSFGMVRLRLTARCTNRQEAEKDIEHYFSLFKQKTKKWLVAAEDINIAEALSRLLRSLGRSVSTAESCTGGYIAHLITSIAGSSDLYKGSVVSYANEVKENLLGVQQQTISKWGAVSEAAVKEMADGALEKMHTDYVIATSGVMGPGGGSEEKPTGTVWIAVAGKNGMKTMKALFPYNRERNIEMTAHTALNLLYRTILEEEGIQMH